MGPSRVLGSSRLEKEVFLVSKLVNPLANEHGMHDPELGQFHLDMTCFIISPIGAIGRDRLEGSSRRLD